MKSPKLTCVAAVLMLLLSMGFTATAQQNDPWKSKLCKEHIGSCGILVTFNPPIKDVLLVPNEVTVEVPLELGRVSQVVVSSYPLGTGMGDVPSEGFVAMYRFQKVGKYARFRGEIKKCTDQGSLTVDVFFEGFERYPMSAGVGGAVECEQSCTTDTQCPSGQRCGFPLGCESKGKCVVPTGKTWCIDAGGRCGCDGHPVNVFCGVGSKSEYTSAPANAVAPCPRSCNQESGCGQTGLVCQNGFCVKP
jgi:hypothetical protein